MAGIARAAAETYARFDIPSIPLGRNKKPSIGDFKVAELSVQQSMAWFRQRPNADALGVPDGRLSGIVRLDIDEHGEQVERAVIDRAGDTPFKARTASGKLHLLYRYNSERRLTGKPGTANARPWSDIKVDLCGGGGYSISPPSQCGGGEYRFLDDVNLEQLLENRERLPTSASKSRHTRGKSSGCRHRGLRACRNSSTDEDGALAGFRSFAFPAFRTPTAAKRQRR